MSRLQWYLNILHTDAPNVPYPVAPSNIASTQHPLALACTLPHAPTYATDAEIETALAQRDLHNLS